MEVHNLRPYFPVDRKGNKEESWLKYFREKESRGVVTHMFGGYEEMMDTFMSKMIYLYIYYLKTVKKKIYTVSLSIICHHW